MVYIVFKIFCDIVLGYTLSTLLFLIFYRFSTQFKYLKSRYLDISNKLIVILSTTFYALYCIILIFDKSYDFQKFIYTTLACFIIPMLFIFKKLRQKYFIIFFVMLSLVTFTNYEKVVIYITNVYRDYLPSSWSVDYTSVWNFSPIIACLFYFFAVMLLIRVKKTNG